MPPESERRLQQHAMTARATETPLEREGRLESQQNCTTTSRANET